MPHLLRTLRAALFPNNSLAPPRAIPDSEEAMQIKRRAADAVVEALPPSVCRVYFASSDRDDWIASVEGWLDIVGDEYLNKHLVVRIVELVVVSIMPELAEQGAEELLMERLGAV